MASHIQPPPFLNIYTLQTIFFFQVMYTYTFGNFLPSFNFLRSVFSTFYIWSLFSFSHSTFGLSMFGHASFGHGLVC
jgi:hypothetical protein